MLIINTVKKISVLALALFMLAACSQEKQLQGARKDASEAKRYYEQAVSGYKELAKKSGGRSQLYLELGRLYYSYGDFESAAQAFKKSSEEEAQRLLAVSYYRIGEFADALDAFAKKEIKDAEYLYYQGLTCEKLNLFDEALSAYRKIENGRWKAMAAQRIDIIERQGKASLIKDLDPQVSQMISSAPSATDHPQAGAVILYCDEKIDVTVDNKEISTSQYLVKILNERGKEKYSEASVEYDSTFEKVELEYARTIKPDGSVVNVGSRHIRDVSKYLNFPLYSNARVYIISFPEVAIGSVIEYKVRVVRNQLINKKDVVLGYPLQSLEPIAIANLTFSIPKARPLYVKVLNEKYNNFKAELKPVIRESGGLTVYSWKFRDIPEIIPEPDMPPYNEINPSMLLSTFDSWEEVYKWWWELARDKMKPDDSISEKVRELTRGRSTPREKAEAIYNFCAQEIRYVAVEYGQAGYEPHAAGDIFRNKYGDCKDQAVLLVTMLKCAGLESWPLLISTRDYYNLSPDFPASLFNHCIAAVYLDGGIVFMDPTAETCSFGDLPSGDQQRRIMLFKDTGHIILDTPLYPMEHNLLKQSYSIAVDESESISAQKSVWGIGAYGQRQRYWLLYTQPELIKNILKEKIQELTVGGMLGDYAIEGLKDLSRPIVLKYDFKGPEFFTAAGALRIMPQLSSLDASLSAKDTRKYPIEFDMLDTQEMRYQISIPSGYKIKYMPKDIKEDSPWLRLCVGYEQKGGNINFLQKIELKERVIPEEKYPEFKAYFDGLIKKLKQRVVLERQGKI